ncbi:glycerol kinase GlpK [Sphingosinicella sp. BN140058]|uniref:FGGY family carbohydrate kinase n=1 Tax=Sphingosinicella sp. BN140058 TaxID=1892855 RepID=UPI0010139E34|nr:glycerol kinase [Sphingosinicella sp. BN140058]QAY75235.1 glycerol kinase [Sphingosinicella sp. BN140058]
MDLLVIDEGTTSTRAMLFAADGLCHGSEQRDLVQHHPGPGLVEHDAEEIWAKSLACARTLIEDKGAAGRIRALGITNQRETIVFWSRRTGRPLAPAIVWQDRRTADACARLKTEGREPFIQAKTGLLLDPYFSASKIAWALAHWPQLREAGDDLCIGTVESYLVFRLTGGLHVSDATNASRTALMDIAAGSWDEELLDLWGVPRGALPEIVDCAGPIGETLPELFGGPLPIAGLAGDQQAAAIGQACFAPGDTKGTYGTGAFILTHTGTELRRSRHRLLSTIAWQLGGARRYALEGSVFVAGSLVKWLRDGLGLLGHAGESESLARSVPDNGGVYLVPALSGLGAPHWQPDARAALSGLSFASGRAHVARAALEAMAHQTHDLMTAFAGDGARWHCLKVDGGMIGNDWIAQDLADMLDLDVERPRFVETTALGAAMLAGVGSGLFASLEEAAGMRGAVERFAPAMTSAARDARLAGWGQAVARVLG